MKAQEEVQVEDEHIEGVQVFSQLQVEKERKEKDRLAKLKAVQPTAVLEPAKDEVQTLIYCALDKHIYQGITYQKWSPLSHFLRLIFNLWSEGPPRLLFRQHFELT